MHLALTNGYTHPANEVALVSVQRQSEQNGGGIKSAMKTIWQLEGLLQAASQSALTTAIRLLEAAYSQDGFAAVFYDNNGAASAHTLGGYGSRNGCKVVSGVNWGWHNGAEYSTFRSYSITLEADYDNPFSDIWEFNETVSRVGNTGPKRIWKHNLNAEPQLQITWKKTTQRVVQRGTIVGMFRYLPPPPPIWPFAMHDDQEEFTQGSPRRYGPVGRPYYREFPSQYSYSFESNIPLIGKPAFWV